MQKNKRKVQENAKKTKFLMSRSAENSKLEGQQGHCSEAEKHRMQLQKNETPLCSEKIVK